MFAVFFYRVLSSIQFNERGYTSDRNRDDRCTHLFVGSMMEGRIPGTGHIERIVFNSRGEEIRREGILRELKARITDVQEGPDGRLYVLTDEEDGALLILEPVM